MTTPPPSDTKGSAQRASSCTRETAAAQYKVTASKFTPTSPQILCREVAAAGPAVLHGGPAPKQRLAPSTSAAGLTPRMDRLAPSTSAAGLSPRMDRLVPSTSATGLTPRSLLAAPASHGPPASAQRQPPNLSMQVQRLGPATGGLCPLEPPSQCAQIQRLGHSMSTTNCEAVSARTRRWSHSAAVSQASPQSAHPHAQRQFEATPALAPQSAWQFARQPVPQVGKASELEAARIIQEIREKYQVQAASSMSKPGGEEAAPLSARRRQFLV